MSVLLSMDGDSPEGPDGFAHYLHAQRYGIVSVLPSHTKRWKEVTHHQPLKTDAKDALGIVDLRAHGHFVGFPFLELPYAELRYLVSARERLRVLHRAGLTRLRTILQVVFPEFERLFGRFTKRTPLALLASFPGPARLVDSASSGQHCTGNRHSLRPQRAGARIADRGINQLAGLRARWRC
jgi:transposase